MAYATVSGMPESKRRAQRRAVITLTSMSAFLLVSLLVALSFAQGWLGGGTPGPASTASACTSPPRPSSVTLNVYNATDQDGLARAVAILLAEQGFRISTVGNDPVKRRVRAVAALRFGPNGIQHVKTVAQRVPGARFNPDNRDDTTVDLVLGDRYRRLSSVSSSLGATC